MIGRNEPLHKVFLSPEIGLEINEVLAGASLAYGDIGKRFEVHLSEYIGCNQILSCSTNPIYLALLALDLRPGDEVLMSPLTCLMSTQPLALLNLKPVWVDIDPTRGSIDPSDLKSKITSRTRAVILFHWCGYPGYLREIAELCDGEGLVLISDASQAFGSEFEDKQLGSDFLADITCFNFTPVRAPTCLDGGSIAFKSSQYFERAMLCRDLGVNRKFLDNNMNVQLSLSDIFRTWGDRVVSSDLTGSNFDLARTFDSRVFRLSVTYKFGNVKLKSTNKRGNTQDEERRLN